MTRQKLIDRLLNSFGDNFADDTAQAVVSGDCVGELYDLAAAKTSLPLSRNNLQQLRFRAAYVLERIFFDYPEYFSPFTESFFHDFPKTENESAKRHFTKMMAQLLRVQKPEKNLCGDIAEACANWAALPNTRVAVKIGAMEVLFELRDDVEWIKDILPELIEVLKIDPTPAVMVRLKRWKSNYL